MASSLPEDNMAVLNNFIFIGDGESEPTNWKKVTEIGRADGGSSVVHIATIEVDERVIEIAVKQIKLQEMEKEEKHEKLFEVEKSDWAKLSHERIVRFYGFCETKSDLYVFMEYMAYESVDELTEKRGLQSHRAKNFTRQLLEGVEYLHSKGIMHRNIKPTNVLVKDLWNVKLSDFGVVKSYTANCGTSRYMAPEMLSPDGHSFPVDIWSSGCVVLKMTTGKCPFPKLSENQINDALMSKKMPAIPKRLPKEVKRFLRKILKIEPTDRPTALDLLSDIFFTDDVKVTGTRWNINLESSFDSEDTSPNGEDNSSSDDGSYSPPGSRYIAQDFIAMLRNAGAPNVDKMERELFLDKMERELFLDKMERELFLDYDACLESAAKKLKDLLPDLGKTSDHLADTTSTNDSTLSLAKSAQISVPTLGGISSVSEAGRRDMVKTSEYNVLIVTLDGETLMIPVNEDEEVKSFRKKVETATSVPDIQQYLVNADGKELKDGKKLSDCNVVNNSFVYCKARLTENSESI